VDRPAAAGEEGEHREQRGARQRGGLLASDAGLASYIGEPLAVGLVKLGCPVA
jgi:hypothetical protein